MIKGKNHLTFTSMKNKGFTLIEILIVVAIIAILASVVLVGLGPTQQAARDSRRVSDVREVQNGLELFYNKCGYYPGSINSGACATALPAAATCNGISAGNTYCGVSATLTGAGLQISAVPNDPIGGRSYGYAANLANSPTNYIVQATLENSSSQAFSGYSAPTAANFKTGDNSGGTWTCAQANAQFCVTL